MSKRPADIIISTPASKVRRRLNFDSPYASRAAAPIVRVTKARAWTNRPMNRKPRMYRMYRSPDVPRGCESACKVHSFKSRHDIQHNGKVMCVNDVTLGIGLTQRVGKMFCVKSVFVLCKIWMDDLMFTKAHKYIVMFVLVTDRRPDEKLLYFCDLFNLFNFDPLLPTVKNVLRDKSQVFKNWHATVTGGLLSSKEQALVKIFIKVSSYVVYNHQDAGGSENHFENALLFYMACTHASNPVYATLKIRIYFYDSVSN
uniref:Capsid protein n=1 Tax=Papaya leaf crumple virus TaxID=928315 RepID=A0A0X9I6K6_9GEMI|nr:coat protein [Papaya leaf crumple virus]